MIPLAASSMAITHTTYTNGVAAPENGVENCGLKNVETAGPMIAADMTTAPTGATALRRSPTWAAGLSCVRAAIRLRLPVEAGQARRRARCIMWEAAVSIHQSRGNDAPAHVRGLDELGREARIAPRREVAWATHPAIAARRHLP